MFRIKTLLIILTVLATESYGQVDSLSTDSIPEVEKKSKLRPMVGLGVGTFTFYGDTGRGLRSNNPFNSSLALSFNAQVPVTYFLDLNFSAVFSQLTLNEPDFNLRNNFTSEITGGSAILTYNFENLLPKSAFWQPYIGTGISSFEFLSKADLYDKNGLEYHLWEDGSLMSLSEDDPNVSEAVMVERDYVYETDLRSLNRENNGNYNDHTFSIPLSAGVNLKFSEHLKGRLGTTLFLNFNDLADDVSSSENRGDGRKDKFLHTSLSMSYDLFMKTKKEQQFDIEFDEESDDFLTADYWDSDLDGVNDLDDDCLGHPEGVEVDERGCPLDKDEDGIPDYRDDEPMSDKEALVDIYGVTIEDETFLDTYIYWIDSLGTDELYTRVQGEKGEEHYSVLVLPDRKGLNQSEINSILAEENVRPVNEDGEEGFLIGDFTSLPDAVNKKLELSENGIIGAVQKEIEGERTDIDDEISAMNSVVSERNSVLGLSNENDQNVLYRVQVGAFRYDLSQNIFSGIDDLLVLNGDDGLTRYMTESYSDVSSAADRRVDLLTLGFEDAFITAYKGGERITLSSAGLSVVEDAKDLIFDEENNSISPEMIKFQIQLGEYVNEIPTETLEKFLELGKVKPVKDGVITRYLFGKYSTHAEGLNELNRLREDGFLGVELKGEFSGRIISLEEALDILGKKDQSFLD